MKDIEYYGCFFTDNAIYIIMELIRSRIDLLTFIYSKKYLLTYELKMQILGFGKDVKVIEPKELRAEIHQIAKSVVDLYK